MASALVSFILGDKVDAVAVFMKGMQTQYFTNMHGQEWVLFLDITVMLRLKKEDFRGYATRLKNQCESEGGGISKPERWNV